MLGLKLPGMIALLLAVAGLAAGCNIGPSAPDQPTYEADVRPILMSRCVRCHGSPPMGDPTSGAPVRTRRFDVYEDTPCNVLDAGIADSNCVTSGAHSSAAAIVIYILRAQEVGGMPPAPAPRLTSYQSDTIQRWAKNPIQQ